MMKFFGMMTAVALAAGCATKDVTKDVNYYIRPKPMNDGVPTSVEWQNENDARLKAATAPEALAKFVESDAAADALLARIGPAYKGDPLVLTQIGSVTQLVMCPKCDKAPARRKIWVAALERAKANATDDYVKTFCRQQLDLCR